MSLPKGPSWIPNIDPSNDASCGGRFRRATSALARTSTLPRAFNGSCTCAARTAGIRGASRSQSRRGRSKPSQDVNPWAARRKSKLDAGERSMGARVVLYRLEQTFPRLLDYRSHTFRPDASAGGNAVPKSVRSGLDAAARCRIIAGKWKRRSHPSTTRPSTSMRQSWTCSSIRSAPLSSRCGRWPVRCRISKPASRG